MQKGDFEEMRAKQDAILFDASNSIRNPFMDVEANPLLLTVNVGAVDLAGQDHPYQRICKPTGHHRVPDGYSAPERRCSHIIGHRR